MAALLRDLVEKSRRSVSKFILGAIALARRKAHSTSVIDYTIIRRRDFTRTGRRMKSSNFSLTTTTSRGISATNAIPYKVFHKIVGTVGAVSHTTIPITDTRYAVMRGTTPIAFSKGRRCRLEWHGSASHSSTSASRMGTKG
jgi:hypothetical protein